MNDKGVIFDIQRFSVHDGPGIRTVVFMKGCPLSCQWCHNPESQTMAPDLFFEEELCVSCEKCIQVCPQGVHQIINGQRVIKRELCNKCGKCVDACLPAALVLKGRSVTVNDVLDEVLRDKGYYLKSGGGITLSGGDPLAQPKFTKNLLTELKKRNLNTAIETCGHASWEIFKDILDLTDFVMYDFKIYNSALHEAYCGIDNALILQNLRRVVDQGKALLVRIPLIPQISDTDNNLQQIGEFLMQLSIKHVELIPYHAFPKDKCKALGIEYQLSHVATQSSEKLQRMKILMLSLGINASIYI